MRKQLIRFLLSLIIVISFTLPISAQDQSSGVESADFQEETSRKVITAIEINGNEFVSTNTIISKMKTKVGAPFMDNIISDDLKRLYLSGYFEDIEIETDDYKGGVKIIITVTERPVIDQVTFSGISRLRKKDEKLKETLQTKEGSYLDYPSLAEDVRKLEKDYEKIGYSDVDISYDVKVNEETGKADVQFNVVEGKKIIIKNILIEGNQAFSDRRILRLMKTKRAWLFNAGALKDDVFGEDLKRIESFYRSRGYTDVQLDHEISHDSQRPYWLYITLTVNEGKKYLVGNIKIEGNREVSEKELLGKISACTTGKVFNQEGIKKDIAGMQSIYFDQGYITAVISEATYLNPDNGRIDIVYKVIENEIIYVDKIHVRGNVKTKDVVIRRELRIKPGDRFDGDRLRRSKERLQNLGFFEEISYDTAGTNQDNRKDLIVDVKETKTGSFSFGGGYSTVDQFVGFAEVEQKNFDWKNFPYFTGAGQILKFRASFGSISDSFNLSFTEPWLFDYPVSFGFDAYKRSHQRDTDVGYGYDQDVAGGNVRLGREFGEYYRGNLTYRFDRIKISNPTENATEDLTREVGSNVISSVNPVFTFDSRNNVFYPTSGDILTGSFEWAGGALGGDKEFWKFYCRGSHYFPMFRNSVLELRGRAGGAAPYSDTDYIPIYERFFVGGASTVRGYDERRLGPIDPVSKDPLGGNSFLIGNLEYTYPLLDFLKVAAFYDIGNAWQKIADIGSSDDANGVDETGGLKSSLGLGVRVKTPIGPIMLDYGIPLNKEPGEDDKKSGKFHFSVSHGF